MIRCLLKGLFRDRARSLLPFVTVLIGSLLTVVGYGWIRGVMGGMIESSASFESGHVKVMSRAYAAEADQVPNDLAYAGVRALLAELERDHPELEWTPRIKFGGLIDIPNENGETKAQGPAAGLAVDLRSPASPERGLLNLDTAVVRGRLPERPGEILVSDAFAERLGTAPARRRRSSAPRCTAAWRSRTSSSRARSASASPSWTGGPSWPTSPTSRPPSTAPFRIP